MNNAKAKITYGEEIKKRLKEQNDEVQMNLTKLETSKIKNPNKNLVKIDEIKITEKTRKDSIDSKKSDKSNISKKSDKSDKSKHSRKSSNSKDSKKSDKSNKSKHSRK